MKTPRLLLLALGLASCGVVGTTWAQAPSTMDPTLAAKLKPYIKDGKVDAAAVAAAYEALEVSAASVVPARSLAAATSNATSVPAAEAKVQLSIRDSFADLYLFDAPSDVFSAKGATVSYSHDYLAGDDQWGLKGVALLAWVGPTTYDGPILGKAFALYAGADIDRHSAASAKSAESYKLGGSGEVGFNGGDLSHYVRVSGGGVYDRIKRSTNGSLRFEYIPTAKRPDNAAPGQYGWWNWFGYPATIFATSAFPVRTVFEPSIVVAYDRATGGKPVAFSGKSDALRLGPLFAFRAKLVSANPASILNSVTAHLTYQYATEVVGGKTFDLLSTGIGYNLTVDGSAALSATYTVGKDEDSGEKEETFKVGLTVKR